jgi:chemotaxis protein CheX
MSESAPLSAESIDAMVVKAMRHVFQTMVNQDASLVEKSAAYVAPADFAADQILGTVGFVGDLNGLIYIRLDAHFARATAGRVLGMSGSEIAEGGNDLLKDTIGELTNMMVGTFKNGFCDLGYPCKLTLPTIIFGHHPAIPLAKGTIRTIYRFDVAGHAFFVDLQLKLD